MHFVYSSLVCNKFNKVWHESCLNLSSVAKVFLSANWVTGLTVLLLWSPLVHGMVVANYVKAPIISYSKVCYRSDI